MAYRCAAHRTLLVGRTFSAVSDAPYDVVIVGAGMVGMSLAAAIARDGMAKHLSVAVLDRAPVKDCLASPTPPVPDARVSTVTPSSIRFFQRMGAWQHMREHAREFAHMQVWDKSGHGYLRWHARDVGSEAMGAVVENSVIQSACYRAAAESGRVHFLWPRSLEGLRLPPYNPSEAGAAGACEPGSLAEVQMGGGESVWARLVVAADGARSAARHMAALRTVGLPYGQRGLVATVACDAHDTAWQCFLPTGPLALLPVRSGYSNIVWSTTPAHAAELERMAPDAFGAAVSAALQSPAVATSPLARLAPWLRSAGSHAWRDPPAVHARAGCAAKSFPLHLQYAGRYVRPRFALVGDAAHAVHPLAGQGVNLGFGDAAQLRDVLADAVRLGRDVGDLLVLQDEYQQPRMASNTAMMAGLHGLQKVFGTASGTVTDVRNLGMGLINSIPLIRNRLMHIAMGEAPA